MRRRLSGLAIVASLVALLGGLFVQSSWAHPSAPTKSSANALTHPQSAHMAASGAARTYTQDLNFSSAFNTHIFVVKVARGGRTFTADTKDCCIANDHWGVFVIRYGGQSLGASNPNASNCGTGSTSAFSGAATLSGAYIGGEAIQVVLAHCSGVSTFPAGLTVRFRSNVSFTVTQKT